MQRGLQQPSSCGRSRLRATHQQNIARSQLFERQQQHQRRHRAGHIKRIALEVLLPGSKWTFKRFVWGDMVLLGAGELAPVTSSHGTTSPCSREAALRWAATTTRHIPSLARRAGRSAWVPAAHASSPHRTQDPVGASAWRSNRPVLCTEHVQVCTANHRAQQRVLGPSAAHGAATTDPPPPLATCRAPRSPGCAHQPTHMCQAPAGRWVHAAATRYCSGWAYCRVRAQVGLVGGGGIQHQVKCSRPCLNREMRYDTSTTGFPRLL